MKKPTLIIWAVLLFLLFAPFSNHADNTFSLTNEIEARTYFEGIVQFELYYDENAIPDENFKKCYKLLFTNVVNDSYTMIFGCIPIGNYGVRVLHDEDNNGKIDNGCLQPKAGIGLSDNQTIGMSNRRNFAKPSLALNCDKEMMIQMIYL